MKIEPGIYYGVPFEQYAAWDALNNSGMAHLLKSPAHYQANRADDEDTKAKTRGTICHAGTLEPHRFDAEYAIGPDVKLNTKEGKTAWDAFAAANPGKELVRGADGAAMLGVRSRIWSDPHASALLGEPGKSEVSICWRDAATGILCKARIDKLNDPRSMVIDLKSTRDARPYKFRFSVEDYGYYRQGAWNLEGLAALGLPYDAFGIIAVEPEAPYALCCYGLTDDDLELGRDECRQAVAIYAECQHLPPEEWPNLSSKPVALGMDERQRNRVRENIVKREAARDMATAAA